MLSQDSRAGTGHCGKGGQRKTNEGTAARVTNTSPAAPQDAETVRANCAAKQAPTLARRQALAQCHGSVTLLVAQA